MKLLPALMKVYKLAGQKLQDFNDEQKKLTEQVE